MTNETNKINGKSTEHSGAIFSLFARPENHSVSFANNWNKSFSEGEKYGMTRLVLIAERK